MSNPIVQSKFERQFAEFSVEAQWRVTVSAAARVSPETTRSWVVDDLDHALEGIYGLVIHNHLSRPPKKKDAVAVKKRILDIYRQQALLTGHTRNTGWKIDFVGGAL